MRLRALDLVRVAFFTVVAMLVIMLIVQPSLVATIFAVVIAILVFFFIRWHARTTVYSCPECDHQFQISVWIEIISPHTGEKKWMTCPSCGKDSWCRIV